jgi:multidrug efflux pump subunit AcrA (membrane-fusion protein)
VLIASVSLALGITASGCARDSNTTPVQPPDHISVTVTTVAMRDVADIFEAGGVVQARTTATIAARILAPVLEVRAAPGDRVREGQVLIVLDGRDLAAQARRARAGGTSADQDVIAAAADRQAADAGLALARATHARIAGLHAKRSATAQELDDATGALRAAEARAASAAARAQAARTSVDAARAATDAAETTAAFSRLTAPFDGVVTAKLAEPGNMAAPGTPLLRLEDTRGFRLEVRIDESRAGRVAPGAVVPVTLDTGADGLARTLSGAVTEISRAVDADARTFLVKIALPEDAGLRSGMFGRARFGGRSRRALTVPTGALVAHGQMTSAFVVENHIARVRLVDVRGEEVLAGLSEGDVVVVSAPSSLRDGSRVKAGVR